MADVILRLRVDPATGRRELVIDYTSDSDALPMEHEEQHRAVADKVVDGGLRNAKIAVSRATADGASEAATADGASEAAAADEPAAEPAATKQ